MSEPTRRFDPAKWRRLVSEERRALLDPAAFVRSLAIPRGATVADLGAGPGFFTPALAEATGPTGRVLALDVAPEMVALLRAQPLPNQVEVLQSEENRLPLADGTVGLALLAFVLHELTEPLRFLAEARRVMSPDGRLVMLEWVPQEEPIGPPLHERLSAAEGERLLTSAGFAVERHGMANASNYYITAIIAP
ncbi:MAG TPA: methyltransferase domain-containing protein [Gemmatimonadales bacterium]